MSVDPAIRVRILGFGQARAPTRDTCPEAPIKASQCALNHRRDRHRAGASGQVAQPLRRQRHRLFARATGFALERMNNYGCSLIWGHPQGPTGTRAIIELIEELAVAGGGIGLFQGCAAGDSSLACVIEVGDR